MEDFIEFSKDDIDRGKLIEPGWYLVEITDYDKKLSKAGDSTNWVLKGRIIGNDDNGDTKFAGLPTPYWNFNSKAKGFAIGFFEALGGEVAEGKRFSFEQSVGKKIVVFIGNKEYEGRTVSDLQHKYRAVRS